MTKTFLAKRPKTFAPIDVTFIGPEGDTITIPQVAFKYRTRREFARLLDAREAAGGDLKKAVVDEGLTFEQAFVRSDEHTVKLLQESIDSWGLDLPVNADSLLTLVDEAPAGYSALWNTLQAAARDGHLGN